MVLAEGESLDTGWLLEGGGGGASNPNITLHGVLLLDTRHLLDHLHNQNIKDTKTIIMHGPAESQ